MPDRRNIFIVLGVILAVLLVLAWKDNPSSGSVADEDLAQTDQVADAPIDAEAAGTDAQLPDSDGSAQLPRFVEVGADSCVPCKMMQPILDEMRSQYAGKLEIEFADVWKSPELGQKYGVRSIPTQVIYDSSGNEVFRHTGFWPKEEIDAKLKELSIVE